MGATLCTLRLPCLPQSFNRVEMSDDAASKSADGAATQAASQSNMAQIVLVVITVLCLGIAALIGVFFVGPQVTAPIDRLTAAARRLAERDWSVELEETKRNDELGETAATPMP